MPSQLGPKSEKHADSSINAQKNTKGRPSSEIFMHEHSPKVDHFKIIEKCWDFDYTISSPFKNRILNNQTFEFLSNYLIFRFLLFTFLLSLSFKFALRCRPEFHSLEMNSTILLLHLNRSDDDKTLGRNAFALYIDILWRLFEGSFIIKQKKDIRYQEKQIQRGMKFINHPN